MMLWGEQGEMPQSTQYKRSWARHTLDTQCRHLILPYRYLHIIMCRF